MIKKHEATKYNLTEDLAIGEKILFLAERIRKKPAPGKFYKQLVQSISYFNKKETFFVRNKPKNNKNTYYWVKNSKINKFLIKKFQRHKTVFLCK